MRTPSPRPPLHKGTGDGTQYPVRCHLWITTIQTDKETAAMPLTDDKPAPTKIIVVVPHGTTVKYVVSRYVREPLFIDAAALAPSPITPHGNTHPLFGLPVYAADPKEPA